MIYVACFLRSGDSQPLDVCAVHHKSSLVRYSVSLVGYGFYGDVLAESERHRWMGPLRYDYAGEGGGSGVKGRNPGGIASVGYSDLTARAESQVGTASLNVLRIRR